MCCTYVYRTGLIDDWELVKDSHWVSHVSCCGGGSGSGVSRNVTRTAEPCPHAINMYDEVEVQLHAFLTFTPQPLAHRIGGWLGPEELPCRELNSRSSSRSPVSDCVIPEVELTPLWRSAPCLRGNHQFGPPSHWSRDTECAHSSWCSSSHLYCSCMSRLTALSLKFIRPLCCVALQLGYKNTFRCYGCFPPFSIYIPFLGKMNPFFHNILLGWEKKKD